MPDPDVFLSYSHKDADRVSPLASLLAEGRSLWWDHELEAGSQFRDVIAGMLGAASAVVVVWSRSSIRRRFVLDEADEGSRRGVLVPVRIDPVQPPLGFRQLQYADLVGWTGGDHRELRKLLRAVDALIDRLVKPPDRYWPDLKSSSQWTSQAAKRLGRLTLDAATVARLLEPGSPEMAKLEVALREVYRTYEVVRDAIDAFLLPGKRRSPMTAEYFDELARGRLIVDVQARRGHCTAIGVAYWGHDGIRSTLTGASRRELGQLDRAFRALSTADGDLFEQMTQIAGTLAGEAATIANHLTAGQKDAARARLAEDARLLRGLEGTLSREVGTVVGVAGQLGLQLTDG